jgi:hypothetical protein
MGLGILNVKSFTLLYSLSPNSKINFVTEYKAISFTEEVNYLNELCFESVFFFSL